MKNLLVALTGLLLTFFLFSGCQQKESTEGLVEIPDSNFYIRLPENYRVVYSHRHSLMVEEEIRVEGTIVPFFVSRSNFSIWISPTIFEVSAFQRGPVDFNPLDMFGTYYLEPERIDSNDFEIYFAEGVEQKEYEVQHLVMGIVVEGRTGISIHASGEFSDQSEAYRVVKEILESVRKITD